MKSADLNYKERLENVIPAGAHTYSRGADQFSSNAPQILEKGEGAYVWDDQGNKFLDFGMALRAVTVGYGFKPIAEAAIKQIRNGNGLTRPSTIELEAAELLRDLIPWVDMVKFAKNGSTVTTAAIKLARAYNGKKMVARCLQHPFFSFDDWFIGDTAMNCGVLKEEKASTVNFNFNDIESLATLFEKYPGQISAVILEPATTEEPQDRFLHKVKALCEKYQAVFILDEMITGFRWDLKGACNYYQIEPDLITFGKGMANGFSVAALGGKREIMELGGLKHGQERVFLISTTHGAEMCGLGAFVETIKQYQKLDVVGQIKQSGQQLMDGFNAIAHELGIEEYVQMIGTPFSPNYLTYDADKQLSVAFRTLFSQEMIKEKVLMPWVAISYSHQEAEIKVALNAVKKALMVYKKALAEGVDQYLVGDAIKPVFRKFN